MMSTLRTDGIPRRLLLATDLTARCDRAFARAVELSRLWQAPLAIVHVTEAVAEVDAILLRPPSSWASASAHTARRQRIERYLQADLSDAGIAGEVFVAAGDVATETIRIAAMDGAGMIVTGIAGGGGVLPLLLGRTVDRITHVTRLPALVVKGRVRAPYRKIVVAIDFSETARHMLATTLRFFPHAEIILFHAYDVPHHGFAGDADALRQSYRARAASDLDAFLAPLGKDAVRLPRLVEAGSAAELLQDYVGYVGADLVAIGSHGRSAVFDILLGSTAERILADVACDTLLITDPRAKRG